MYTQTQSATTSVFASISLTWTDKLRLHQFPASVTQEIADQLRASWPPGIKSEQDLPHGAHEFKFKGTPFGTFGTQEGVGSRRLIRDVLAFLYARGWTLVVPLSHSQRKGSKDSLVFRQRSIERGPGLEKGEGAAAARVEVLVPPPVEWLVIAPAAGDKLRVIYDGSLKLSGGSAVAAAAGGKQHDHDELGVLVQSLKQVLLGMDYFQAGTWSHDSFEFKFKGYPWSALKDEKRVKVERLLLEVLDVLERFGWRSYATVRHRSDTDDVRKQDTWFFVRDEDWVPESPPIRKSS
jgi:hypothetical protein